MIKEANIIRILFEINWNQILAGVLLIFNFLWLKYELEIKIVPRKSDSLRSPNWHFPQTALAHLHIASGLNPQTAVTPK